MEPKDKPPIPGGLRERNKREKLARIIAAARDAFGRNGYERTTLREVAEAAEIGTGTLFLYAPTKEDLLVLVFKRELEPVVDESFESVPETDLLSQMIHVFGAVTEHHSQNLGLSRPFLKDLMFVSDALSAEVAEFNRRWLERIAELIDKAKARGEIWPDVDSRLLATCSRQLFIAGLRAWVAGRTTRERFDESLPSSLGLLLRGLGPAPR
jgi:AcrR family transcriptional regulator